MGKLKVIFVAVLLLFSFSLNTYAQNLNYWYSDSKDIGHLTDNHYIWVNLIDGFSSSKFNTFQKYAKDTWYSKAGIYTYNGPVESYAAIKWYGGNDATLEDLEPLLAYYAAVTVRVAKAGPNSVFYNGALKYDWGHLKMEIYTPKQPLIAFYTDKKYRTMFTHELGHAIGWWGHSSNSSDLMYPSASTDIPTSRDINHIKQVY